MNATHVCFKWTTILDECWRERGREREGERCINTWRQWGVTTEGGGGHGHAGGGGHMQSTWGERPGGETPSGCDAVGSSNRAKALVGWSAPGAASLPPGGGRGFCGEHRGGICLYIHGIKACHGVVEQSPFYSIWIYIYTAAYVARIMDRQVTTTRSIYNQQKPLQLSHKQAI